LINMVKTNVASLLAFGAVTAVLFGYFYATQKIKSDEWEEEKKCFKELTFIIEQNPEKKEWIEKTIIAEKTVLSGTRYCAVLELFTESEKDLVAGKELDEAGKHNKNK